MRVGQQGGQLVEHELNLGLNALDDAVAIVVLHREVEAGDAAVALVADSHLVNGVGDTVGDDIVTHLQGMAARQQKTGIG